MPEFRIWGVATLSAASASTANLAPRVLLRRVEPEALAGAFQLMTRLPGRALLLQDVGPDVGGQLGLLRQLLRGFRDAAFGLFGEVEKDSHTGLPQLPMPSAAELLQRL